MREARLIATAVALIGVAFSWSAIAIAAPPPSDPSPGDSVSLTQGPATFGDGFTIDELSATSGPSGENPSGEVRFGASSFSDFGPVTCLTVSGNVATLNFESQFIFVGQIVTVRVVDDDPDTISILPLGRAATDCSSPPTINVNPLTSGDITVADAQPVPTTVAQCKKGGWRQFGFKNQGQCIRFVKPAPRQ